MSRYRRRCVVTNAIVMAPDARFDTGLLTHHAGNSCMQILAVAPPISSGSIVNDETALVRAAQENPAAFAPLYERYLGRVYAYLRARTRSIEDADDLTQHVFLQALQALPQYRAQKAPFAAWLFRIARNAATDYHRRHRSTVTWDLVPEALQPVDDQDMEAGIFQQEALTRLGTLFAALDAHKRELLVLRFTLRLTAAESAMVVGKSEAAVKKQLTRAMRTLEEQYRAADTIS